MSYTLYGYGRNPRTRAVRIVAAAEEIELEHAVVIPRQGINKLDYMARFPRSRGKIPALEGPNIKLTETLAIVIYLSSIHNRAKLLGSGSPEEAAEIISWASWANQEFLQVAAQWFLPLIPSFTDPAPYNKESVAAGRVSMLDILEYLETHLESRSYLVTDSISIADIMLGIYISRLFEWVLDRKWRESHPSIMRFFGKFVNDDIVKKVLSPEDFTLIEVETLNENPLLKAS